MTSQPFFSIGVPTFDRDGLLVETIQSVLSQSFDDFEVIVANDNPARVVDSTTTALSDSRVRFVNHPRNLGGVGNFNYLMEVARGRYFTWLGDDDLLLAGSLVRMREMIEKNPTLRCLFPSYVSGETCPELPATVRPPELLSGRAWLGKYLGRQARVQGCYGAFEIGYVRSTGGFCQLGSAWYSPYADNLLAVKAGLLDGVGYFADPLIFYRTHGQSISNSSDSVQGYCEAQRAWVPRCREVFLAPQLLDDLDTNVALLVQWCVKDYCSIVRRSGRLDWGQMKAHLAFLSSTAGLARTGRCALRLHIFTAALRLVRDLALRRQQAAPRA